MRKRIAIGVAAGVLAIAGGTALAQPDGGPFGLGGDPKEEKADFARDLASKLDGVSAQQVERALDQVHSERRAEHRAELGKALAGELDGVSEQEAADALEKFEAAMRRGFERRERPAGPPHDVLAKELGVSQTQLEKAFRAIHEKRLDARLDEEVEEGRLSKGEADRIRERTKDGPPRFERRLRRGPGGPGVRDHVVPAPVPPHGGAGFVMPAPPPPPE